MCSNKKIPLYSLPDKNLKRFRKHLILLILLTLLIVLVYYLVNLNSKPTDTNEVLFFVYFFIPLYLFWDAKNKEKFFIQIQSKKLIFKNTIWIKQFEVSIDNIRFIEINLTDIYVVTNDQKSFKLDIGYMLHSDMQEVKKELKVFRMKAYDLVRPKG